MYANVGTTFINWGECVARDKGGPKKLVTYSLCILVVLNLGGKLSTQGGTKRYI